MKPFKRQTPNIFFAHFLPTSFSLRRGPLNFFEVGSVTPHHKFRAGLDTSSTRHGVQEVGTGGLSRLEGHPSYQALEIEAPEISGPN
jgi:hypothetical protein